MPTNLSLKATWSHDPLAATNQTALAYLLLDITQPSSGIGVGAPPETARPANGAKGEESARGHGAQPLNVSLVLDTSGSMAGEKLHNLKRAVAWVVDHLTPRDRIAITLFDEEVRPLIASTTVAAPDDRKALLDKVEAIREAGGTAMSKGLEVGLAEARSGRTTGAVSRVILLTDGQTWGDAERCVELAAEAGAAGIPVTSLGVGAEEDWSIELLDAIAGESGGNVDYIAKPEEIAVAFEGTLRAMHATTARNLRITFSPTGGVSARAVYRVAPMISRLWPSVEQAGTAGGEQAIANDQQGQSSNLTLPLGDMQSAEGQTLLFEVLVPARKPGSYRLAHLQLEYEGDAGAAKSEEALDLVVSFDAGAAKGPGNPRVMNSVEKATTFKLQTRALQASMAGDVGAATRNLRAAATRLLNMGETELAEATEREAEKMEAAAGNTGEKPSAAGTKKLTFETRKLSVAETARLKD